MAEFLPSLGIHRIFYRSAAFTNDLDVAVIILNPNMGETPELVLSALGRGFYYIDYYFGEQGTYLMDFYEGEIQVASQAYLAYRIGSGRMSGNLLNRSG